MTDANKNITSILYNHLNLPRVIKFNNSNAKKIKYYYDASGVKLRKVVKDGSTITTTDYMANGSVYENDELQFIPTAEGYVTKSGNIYSYVYQFKDHLGNIRLSYADLNNNGTIEASSEILEEKNYYPFGLKHKGYNNVINGTHHPYGYGGKEENEELGLDWHDFGARNYDTSLGRWMNLDPLANKYVNISPYAYVANSPLKYIDPNGKEIIVPTSLKGSERRKIVRNLRRLTNDKLSYNKTTGEVTISKSRTGKKASGSALISRVIGSSKTMTITMGAKGSGNSETDVSPTNAINGTGSDVNVSFDSTSNPDIKTEDSKTGNVSGKKRPSQVGLAHEVIHGDRSMRGAAIDYSITGTHTYKDATGATVTQTVPQEELATVGLKHNTTGDITENNIRKEQRKTKKKKRGAY